MMNPAAPAAQADLAAAGLGDRLARIEKSLAELTDTAPLEERIVKRIYARMDRKQVQASRAASKKGEAEAAAEASAAPVARALPAPVAMLLASPAPPAKLQAPPAPRPVAPPRSLFGRSWLAFDLLDDFRTLYRLIRDPGYRMTWTAKIVPLAALIFILFSNWKIFPWNLIDPTGGMIDKVIDIVVAFFAFKVLQREISRYREMAPGSGIFGS